MTAFVPRTFILGLLTMVALARGGEKPWANLNTLQVGQKIEVVDSKLKSLSGTFLSVSEDAISLHVRGNDVSVPRSNVMRVSLREHSKRGRNALIGAGIGALAIGLPIAGLANIEHGNKSNSITAAGFALGVGLGAGAGAASPSYATLYRAKKQQSKAP